MRFTQTPLAGAYVVELDRRGDDRGSFARAFCAREFAEHGLPTDFVQSNLNSSTSAGTMRGLHFQRAPHEEAKFVRCVAGAIHDMIVDIRPDSPTYLESFGIELTPENGRAVFLPKGFAHGFLTLVPNSTAFYMVDAYYTPGVEGGFRHDDPILGLDWPIPVTTVSDKDRSWPLIEAG